MSTAPTNALAIGNQWQMGSTSVPSNIPGGPNPSLTTEERETPVPETSAWSDTRAAAIALADFQRAEAFRTQNHDWRFRTSDQLYLAWTQRRTWEGTKMPRSSVGIFLSLEQIEAMLPSVISALFPDNNQLPFEVEPRPTSTVDQAQSVQDLIAYQLQDLGDYGKYLTLREIVRRAYKSSLIYGNGIVEFSVLDKWLTRTQLDRVDVPIRKMVPHPLTGEMFPVPTGDFQSHVRKTLVREHCVRPTMMNVDCRDFYIDPNCASHNVQDAGYCVVRSRPTVSQIEEWRGRDDIKLPSMGELLKLATIRSTTQGDTSKKQTEAFRGMTWNPEVDYTTDPNLATVELLRYYQKNRTVWMLGRRWIAMNQPNYFGVLPFLDAFYVDVPGRFYGLSICDLVEGDQKLAEAIINGRIDELNLLIHPPIIKKQGRSFSPSQQRLRPGVIWDSENPKEDFIRFEMGNVTQSAYLEVDALERRVQKKTGVTDLAVLGTPSAGGNSANRTATGVSSQGAASGKRIEYHVENFEDQFIVPALGILHSLNQVFLPLDEYISVLGPNMQNIVIDPVDIRNASVRFKMNASGKLKTRQMLQGGGLAVILQSVLNPALIELNMQQGMALDMKQIDRLLCDTFGLPNTALWVQANPQQLQMYQQTKMAATMAKAQMQTERLQAQTANQDSKDETALLKALLDRILTPDVAHQAINQLLGANLPLPSAKPEPNAASDK